MPPPSYYSVTPLNTFTMATATQQNHSGGIELGGYLQQQQNE
jgi:hypothetical protein